MNEFHDRNGPGVTFRVNTWELHEQVQELLAAAGREFGENFAWLVWDAGTMDEYELEVTIRQVETE